MSYDGSPALEFQTHDLALDGEKTVANDVGQKEEKDDSQKKPRLDYTDHNEDGENASPGFHEVGEYHGEHSISSGDILGEASQDLTKRVLIEEEGSCGQE